jgi:hypothetical protein
VASVDPVLYTNKIKPILELSDASDPDDVELYAKNCHLFTSHF